MARFSLLVLAAAVLAFAAADLGVDVSDPVSQDDFSCLNSQGYINVVIRAWHSTGQPDTNAPQTIMNAWAGGMSNVDVYMFPCYNCGNPEDQVKQTVAALQEYNITSGAGAPNGFGNFWFDIEGTQYWSSNPSDNQNFMQNMLDAANQLGLNIGVYTSESQWGPIMDNWTGASSYPLWYAHYDNNPSMSDFSPFAGWTEPTAKQYNGGTDLCGINADLDYWE